MGDTYIFGAIDKRKLLSGELMDKVDQSGLWDDDPMHQYIHECTFGRDFDRAYYLYDLLFGENGTPEEYSDPEYKDPKVQKFCQYEQIHIVKPEQVQRAIDTLKALDAKIRSMPFKPIGKKPENQRYDYVLGVHSLGRQTIEEYKKEHPDRYVEPMGPEYGCGDYDNDVYFGRSKEDVDIVREIVKVFKWKYHHYYFTWENDDDGPGVFDGAEYLVRNLERVLNMYNKMRDQVLFIHWY